MGMILGKLTDDDRTVIPKLIEVNGPAPFYQDDLGSWRRTKNNEIVQLVTIDAAGLFQKEKNADR